MLDLIARYERFIKSFLAIIIVHSKTITSEFGYYLFWFYSHIFSENNSSSAKKGDVSRKPGILPCSFLGTGTKLKG
jgi:hypothetical protein